MPVEPPPPEETQYQQGIEVEVGNTNEANQDVQQTTAEELVAQDTNQAGTEINPGNGHLDGTFINGLCVGLGLGCIATFVIMWFVIFFTPLVPSAMTYENLLAIFIYPFIYLLAIGLVALTAGIVKQYYTRKSSP